MIEIKRENSENTKVTQEQRDYVEIIKTNCDGIGRLAGFTKLTHLHHNWIFKMLTAQDTWVLQAHRGSYKSSCLCIAIALLIVLFPNKTILFMRKTDEDVKEIVSKVSKVLKTDVFKRIVNVFHNCGLVFLRDTAFEITTNLKTDIGNGKAQLFAMGSSGSLTSKHADIVIVDDIITIKDRTSRVERERIKQIWGELANNIKNPNGRVISIGTPWHIDDAFCLMPEPEKYTCYETGLLGDEEINKLKREMTPAMFAANYELKHVSDADRLFKEVRYTTNIQKIYGGICHVDAGYGGTDHTAFGILKQIDEKHFIAFGKRWNKHIDLCINEIIRLKEKYQAGMLYTETNGDKGYLLKEFQKRNVRCSGYHENMNKHTKISTYLFKTWNNLEFIEDTDDDYIGEILDYCLEVEHDDCADNMACLCRVLSRGKVKAITGLKI